LERKIEKNVYQEAIRPCNRVERRICTREKESIFAVKKEKKKGISICRGPTTKEIHLAIKIATDLTSLFF